MKLSTSLSDVDTRPGFTQFPLVGDVRAPDDIPFILFGAIEGQMDYLKAHVPGLSKRDRFRLAIGDLQRRKPRPQGRVTEYYELETPTITTMIEARAIVQSRRDDLFETAYYMADTRHRWLVEAAPLN